MRVRFTHLAVLAILLALASMVACNDGDSSGGTTDQSAAGGYSAANLAGTWTVCMSVSATPCNKTISFDATGKVLSYVRNPPLPGLQMVGSVKVDATGRLSGQTTLLIGGVKKEQYDWRKLKFTSSDRITGLWLVWELSTPTPTWDPFAVTFKK